MKFLNGVDVEDGHIQLSDTYKIQWGGSNARIDGSNASDYIRLWTSDTERMRIDSSGNVGIGTASPDTKLHVNVASTADYVINANSRLKVKGDGTLWWGAAADYGKLTWDTGKAVVRGESGKALSLGANGSQDTIYINTSQNVGIGTTSPGAKLEVSGSLFFRDFVRGYVGSSSTQYVGATWLNASDGVFYVRSADVDKVVLDSNGDSYFNGGNVGIGTTSPVGRLEVVTTDANRYIRFKAPNGEERFQFYTGGTGNAAVLNMYSSDGTTRNVQIAGGGTSYFNGGNVGIGTTSPSTKLHVKEGNTNILIGADDTYGANYSAIGFGGLTNGFNRIFAGFDGSAVYDDMYYAAGTGKGHQFRTNGSGSTKVIITSAGNVGIGTTSPNVLLDVNKSTIGVYAYFGSGSIRQLKLSSYNTASDHAGHKINASSGNGEITLATNSIAALTVKNNQTLQFNAYTAGYLKSDASGNITVDSDTIEDTLDSVTDRGATTTNNITVGNLTAGGNITTNSGILYSGNATKLDLNQYNSGYLRLLTNNTERVRVTATGNVGIGTTSPTLALDIRGTQGSPSSSGTSQTGSLSIRGGGSHFMSSGMLNVSPWTGWFQAQDANNLATTYPLALNPNGGNVGIGTTSPDAKLDVEGGAVRITYNSSYNLELSNPSGSGIINANGDSATLRFGTTAVGGSTATEKMRISPSGNVGIGTTSPSEKLEVAGNIKIGDSNVMYLGAGNDLQIYHDGSHSYIRDQGSGNLIITGSQLTFSNVADTEYMVKMVQDGMVELYYNGSKKLETTSTGVTVTGAATATTFLGDLNGTINTVTTAVTKANATNDTTVATTAFVQNLIGTIPAGLVFQGTWNAATNTPTLTSGSGTTGHFYIVSTSGSTNLDGVTDWVTGDWAVFIEQGATDAWEKIDNSSVLDGAGTGQTVAKWDGSGTSNTLTNSSITDTGSAVTISNPTTITGPLTVNIDADDTVVIKSVGTNASAVFAASGDELYLGGGNAYSVRYPAGNNYALFDNSNARVGIGTGNPGNKLHIQDGGSGFAGTFDARNKSIIESSGEAYLATYVPDNSFSGLRFFNSTALKGFIDYYHGTQGNALVYSATGYHKFMTSGTEKVRIINNGNVGIGTTNPSERLHVFAEDNGDGILIESSAVGTNRAPALKLFPKSSSANNRYWAISPYKDTPEGLSFSSSNAKGDDPYSSGTTRMLIDGITGNVGIGTTAPGSAFKLDVNGYIKANSRIYVRDSTKTIEIGTDYIQSYVTSGTAVNPIRFFTGSTEKARINGDGNVGIGTTSPSAKLTIDSGSTPQLLLRNSSGTNSKILLEDNSGSTQNASITFDQAGQNNLTIATGYQSSNDENRIYLAPAGNIGLTVRGGTGSNNGNVGIGTTSPTQKLHVVGGSTYAALLDSDQDYTLGLARSGTEEWWLKTYTDGRFAIHENGVGDKVTIKAGGNVGIGTTAPSAKLDVNGVIRSRGGTYAADTDTKTDVGLVIPENNFIYTADGSDYLRKLIGKTSDIITIGEAGTSLIDGINLVPGGAGGYVQIFNNSSIAAKFVDGKLGIGTTNPQSKLQVAGGIQMADDTAAASADKVGTMRYRTGTEYVEVNGTELVTNGDFAADSNWTKETGWTIASGVASYNGTSANNAIYQSPGITTGSIYRLSFSVVNYVSGTLIANLSSGQTSGGTGNITANGDYSFNITASGSLCIFRSTASFSGSIDNVSVIEVTAEDASYADMCMQTGSSTYEWVNIVRNTY